MTLRYLPLRKEIGGGTALHEYHWTRIQEDDGCHLCGHAGQQDLRAGSARCVIRRMAYFLAAHCGEIGFLSRLLFLRSIIRAGLSTAFVHNDAASALPTTPVEVLTRCFFSLDRIPSSTGPHAETRAILPVCSAFPFSALRSPLPFRGRGCRDFAPVCVAGGKPAAMLGPTLGWENLPSHWYFVLPHTAAC